MASIAKFDTWQDSAGKSLYGVRAWVNFNGTGVVAIRASANVSSITDLGTGQYSINFTTAMTDANYAANTCCGHPGGGGTAMYTSVDFTTQSATTVSKLTMFVFSNVNAQVDGANVYAAVIR